MADSVRQPGTYTFFERIRAHPLVTGFYLAVLVGIPVFPCFYKLDHNYMSVLLYVEIYMILALGLNIVVGMTGLLDLGYAMFLSTGAVVCALCLVLTHAPADAATGEAARYMLPVGTTDVSEGSHPFHFPGGLFVILFLAGSVCALLGVLRGIPTLKLTGDYYAIVTLGLAEILFLFYLNTESLTGGAFGIKLLLSDRPEMFGEKLYWDTPFFYYFTFFLLVLTIATMLRLQNSRLGRAWAAIKLDETAARSSGVNVSKYKLIAFAISGFVGGIGGALMTIWMGLAAVKDLDVWQSILILCCVVLGGMGSIPGTLLGTFILISLGEVLREPLPLIELRVPNEARFLIYGLILVFLMRFRPQGLLPLVREGRSPKEDEVKQIARISTPLFTLSTETAHSEEGDE